MMVGQLAAAAGDRLIGTVDKHGDIWLDTGEVVMTVITGLVIVFAMLVLLCVIIFIFGKIMDRGNKNKPEAPKAAKPAPKAAKPAPEAEKGVSPSVVAAISAAIACILGKGKFTIRKITRTSGRKAWGSTGAAENVRPF